MNNKGNNKLIIVLSIIVVILVLALAGVTAMIFINNSENKSDSKHKSAKEKLEAALDDKDVDVSGSGDVEINDAPSPITGMSHKMLINGNAEDLYNTELIPCVMDYTVNPDLSNISNMDAYEYWSWREPFDENMIRALANEGFFIESNAGYDEFFGTYEDNRYYMKSSFITVDSLMHTYHMYFAHLLKTTEKTYLVSALRDITLDMYNESLNMYNELKGTEWENAAVRNVKYFVIASRLLDMNMSVDSTFNDSVVDSEISCIMSAQGIDHSNLFDMEEDYSQYKPRGYYAGDDELEQYFRAMMWFGRMSFEAKEEDMSRSALLMSLAMNNSCIDNWEKIYSITSFFAGASDDCGYYEYLPAIEDAYGTIDDYSDLVGKDDSFNRYMKSIQKMDPPRINSIVINDGDDNVIISFRFMGQRFSVDETIFSNLTYSTLGENSNGDKRYMPDTLDVMATLGSNEALNILEQEGLIDYPDYHKNMQQMMEEFNNSDGTIWNASLYASWLNTLRPLLVERGAGYPKYMQSTKWNKKNLETFAGSYAELKHDTVLYSKQTMAEMGGGWDEFWFDDRGYVDPQVEVYARFALLSQATYDGLSAYGMLTDADRENLNRLTTIAKTFITISEKELVNETLTDEEYEFIRCYGGDLEHFWYDANKIEGIDLYYTEQAPCPVIADIATDPNGECLEVGTGKAQVIYVVVPVDGTLKIARGTVYSFYQFTVPLSERMTDDDWKKKLGVTYSDEYGYYGDPNLRQPEWTQDYRCERNWD